jgi:hypothetical protein
MKLVYLEIIRVASAKLVVVVVILVQIATVVNKVIIYQPKTVSYVLIIVFLVHPQQLLHALAVSKDIIFQLIQ